MESQVWEAKPENSHRKSMIGQITRSSSALCLRAIGLYLPIQLAVIIGPSLFLDTTGRLRLTWAPQRSPIPETIRGAQGGRFSFMNWCMLAKFITPRWM